MSTQWYGELPERWEAKRIAAIFACRKEKNDPIKTDFILSLSAKSGVVPYSERIDKGGNKPKEDLSKYSIAHKYDLLVNCMNVLSGSSGVTKWKGAISPVYYALYPRMDEINIWYYNYIFRLITFYRSLIGIGKGILFHETESGGLNTIRLRIAMANLNNEMLPLPPREEQDQIVRYLDWKVSLINKLINAKRRQIALLQEQKKTIVSDTVTRIGEGWHETRLINLVSSVKAGAWGEDEGGSGVNYDCVRVADFDFERLKVKDTKYTLRNYPQRIIEKLALQNGDILIEKSGGGETQTVGRAVQYTGVKSALYANFIEAVRPNSNTNAMFLTYLLAALYYLQKNKFHFNQTTGIQNLDVKSYLRESMFIPPHSVQKSIALFLDIQCGRIDKIIAKLTDEIALFTEYRTRLISDVVTGKLDVRSVVVPTYEAVEETAAEAEDAANEDATETEE